MAVNCLESLVLRGVSVLCGGKARNLRLGFAVDAADVQPTAVGISMCHPLPDQRPDNRPADGLNRRVPNPTAEHEVGGAGRSHSAGVPHRPVPATTAGRIASPFAAFAAGLLAGKSGKRFETRSSWQEPAGRTLPTTARGTTSR
jgi:hypothetical protein